MLADMNIEDEGCPIVANFLSEHPHFTSIDLKSNKITSSGLNKLCGSFRHMENLEILSLNSNYLGQDPFGLEGLYTLFQGKCSIQQVNLRNNGLMDDSCKTLAAIINTGGNLRRLDLRWNKIDD